MVYKIEEWDNTMAKKQGQQDNGLQNRRMRQYNGQKTGTTAQWFTK